MTRQIIFILLVLSVGFATTNNAQDPIFSQYYAAPLQTNPALAGNSYAPFFALNYRNQWPGLNAYQTYTASYDQYLDYINSGVGVMLHSDNAGNGILKTVKISGIYSYRLRVTDDFFVKLGTEASVVQVRLDWDQLRFLDQIDVENGFTSPGGSIIPSAEQQPDNLTNTYLDMSAGVLAYSKYFYGGLAIKHLNTPNESFLHINDNLNGGLPLRYSVHIGGEIPLFEDNNKGPRTFISPNALYVRQGEFGQWNVGMYAGLGMIYAGAWYRHALTNADAAIIVVGVQKGMFKIGYSYDVTLSALNSESGGAHELSLSIRLREPDVDFNDCLQLFR